MGVAQRAQIARDLPAGGLDPATPIAAVRHATLPTQEVRRARLDELAGTPVESPAIIVVGAVAALGFSPARAPPARPAAPPLPGERGGPAVSGPALPRQGAYGPPHNATRAPVRGKSLSPPARTSPVPPPTARPARSQSR